MLETPNHKPSPPAKKERQGEPIEKTDNKSAAEKVAEMSQKTRKAAKEKAKRADLAIPREETHGARMQTQTKLAKQKSKVEETKEVERKKVKLRKKLVENGLKGEALLAFESAYDPKISPKIKQILADKKLNIREPETWDKVHKLLTTPSKEQPYFSEAYVDKHENFIPTAPLVPKEREGGVRMADAGEAEKMGPFDPLDLSEEDEKKPERLGLSPYEEFMLNSTLAIVHPEILNTGWTDVTDQAIKNYIERHRAEGRDMEDGEAWMHTMGEVDSEIPISVADFSDTDLEGGNIITGNEEEGTVDRKRPSDEDMIRVTGIPTRKPR